MSEKLPEGFVLNEQANALPPGFVLNQPAAPAKMSEAQQWSEAAKNVGSAAARPVVQAIASLPLMAMDTGVAARNLVTNLSRGVMPTFADFNPFASTGGSPQPNELPSRMFNRSLNTFTREPEGMGRAAELASTILLGSRVPAPQAAQQAPVGFRPQADPQFDKAVKFATDEKLPFPLSSAAPNTLGGQAQGASRFLGISGEIKTQSDATKVTTYLNNTVGRFTEKGEVSVFDAAAKRGQQFFAQIVNPNKVGATEAWKTAKETMGAHGSVPISKTLEAAQKARDALKGAGSEVGQKGDEFYTALDRFLANGGTERTVEQLDLFASKITKAGFKGPTAQLARRIQDAIEDDVVARATALGMDDVATSFTQGLQKRALYRDLAKIPQLERLAGELGAGGRGGTKGSIDWINSLFTKGNGKALAKIREADPELYHDLADAWLAKQINDASGYSQSGIVKTVDGVSLRTWFETNQDKIKEIFGAPQTRALDNFTIYAKYMTGAVAEQSVKDSATNRAALIARGVGELAGLKYKPGIVIGSEAAAFVLARELARPNGALFNLFTQGFSPATRSFAVKSGALAAQQASSAANRGQDSR